MLKTVLATSFCG